MTTGMRTCAKLSLLALLSLAVAGCAPRGPRSPIEALCPPPPPEPYETAVHPDAPIHARTVHAGLKVMHATLDNMHDQITPGARAWNPRCGF